MSDIVEITCTETMHNRVKQRLTELQIRDPAADHDITSAVDDLIHHGYMLTWLPQKKIAEVVNMANKAYVDQEGKRPFELIDGDDRQQFIAQEVPDEG